MIHLVAELLTPVTKLETSFTFLEDGTVKRHSTISTSSI